MRLESGPAAYDRNYYLIFMLMCIALGAYFCYDYLIGYPNKNREAAQKRLALLPGVDEVPTEFAESPTKPMFDRLKEDQPTDPDTVHHRLGQPSAINRENHRTFEYFVSAYGMAEVPIIRGQVDPKNMRWTTWYKTQDEIRLQLYCALIAFAIGLYPLYRARKATTLRAVIDDEGMVYGGRRITSDSMTRLCDYNRKGWVDLYYQHGREQRKLRIDNQKIRKFEEIIDALCELKGFEDPRRAVEEAEAGEQPKAGPESEAAAESAEPTDDNDKP